MPFIKIIGDKAATSIALAVSYSFNWRDAWMNNNIIIDRLYIIKFVFRISLYIIVFIIIIYIIYVSM